MISALPAITLLLCAVTALAQRPQPPEPRFQVSAPSQVECVVEQPCEFRPLLRGAEPPVAWRILRGALPRGIELDPRTGLISGKAAIAGQFQLELEARDSADPVNRATLRLTLIVFNYLTGEWEALPAVRAGAIEGRLRVTNRTGDEVDLTVIVVAINEIGKAFALGYQRFAIRPNATSPAIPFAMQQMPRGRYRVRADVIGEVEPKNRIYRTSREAGPLAVP